MASTREYVEFVAGQLSGAGAITYRKLFGEYGLYCDGKFFGTVEGKVFWAEYVGRTVCEKYECCVIQKKLAHCGKCGELPCRRYDLDDPNLSPEENKRIREENIKLLRSLQ